MKSIIVALSLILVLCSFNKERRYFMVDYRLSCRHKVHQVTGTLPMLTKGIKPTNGRCKEMVSNFLMDYQVHCNDTANITILEVREIDNADPFFFAYEWHQIR